MKQKQANAAEVRTANVQAIQADKQGKTLMVSILSLVWFNQEVALNKLTRTCMEWLKRVRTYCP